MSIWFVWLSFISNAFTSFLSLYILLNLVLYYIYITKHFWNNAPSFFILKISVSVKWIFIFKLQLWKRLRISEIVPHFVVYLWLFLDFDNSFTSNARCAKWRVHSLSYGAKFITHVSKYIACIHSFFYLLKKASGF